MIMSVFLHACKRVLRGTACLFFFFFFVIHCLPFFQLFLLQGIFASFFRPPEGELQK